MPNDTQGKPPSSRPSRFFSHPAVLIALTAAATTGLAPWVSSLWTDHDKAVEATRIEKTQLATEKLAIVRQMGVASGQFLANADTLDLFRKPHDLDGPFREFDKASYDISSELAAYEPDSQAAARWGGLVYSVRGAYKLIVSLSHKFMSSSIFSLSNYFRTPASNIDGLCREAGNGAFGFALQALSLNFQHKEQSAVASVIAYPDKLESEPAVKPADRAACNHVKRTVTAGSTRTPPN